MQLVVGPGLENDSHDDSPVSRYFKTLLSRKPASTLHFLWSISPVFFEASSELLFVSFDMVDTVGVWC